MIRAAWVSSEGSGKIQNDDKVSYGSSLDHGGAAADFPGGGVPAGSALPPPAAGGRTAVGGEPAAHRPVPGRPSERGAGRGGQGPLPRVAGARRGGRGGGQLAPRRAI